MYRLAKLTPWYHQQKPRCVTQTLMEQQCTFSATYVVIGDEDKTLCKTHADIWAVHEGPVKPIPESQVFIRPDY